MRFFKKKLKLRLYQQTILANCYQKDSLIVLPTGLGKTFIAVGLAGLSLKKGLVIITAPTKPLCVQHQKTFSTFFSPSEELVVMTGAVKPNERKELWKNTKIVFCTPQTLERDILRGYLDLSKVSLLVIDEAHRATGDYAYVWLAKLFSERSKGHILALSASPASTREGIDEICKNLRVKHIEVKTEGDMDVSPYIKKKDIIKIEVNLPREILEIKSQLELCLRSRLKNLKDAGLIYSSDVTKVRKTDLLALQKRLAGELSSKHMEKYAQISTVASCLKLQHVLMMVQTQGIENVVDFFKKLEKQAKTIKASKQLLNDWNFKKAVIKAYDSAGKGIEHPKIQALRKLILEEISKGGKIIVFAHFRSSVDRLVKILENLKGVKPRRFIGQKEGMNQREQVAAISCFRDGKYNVLVTSSVGEEGIDIPSVPVGIFFEPVSSALRSVQRRGRVGRTDISKIYMLITKNTIDEGYYWSAIRKERAMHSLLEDIKEDIENKSQLKLGDFSS